MRWVATAVDDEERRLALGIGGLARVPAGVLGGVEQLAGQRGLAGDDLRTAIERLEEL